MKQVLVMDYLAEEEAKKIVEKLNHKTYMNWELSYSNCAGNCTLIITCDKNYDEKEVLDMFYYVALTELAKC